MEQEQTPEPTGVCLKAAYLLLRELRRYPQLPSVEQMAIILDLTLNYEWAVRIIRIEDEMSRAVPGDGSADFTHWAENVLLGADMRNVETSESDATPESFIGIVGTPKPSLYPPPPREKA